MNLLLPHVAARVFDVPLMIDARKAAAILAGIGGRIVEGGVTVEGVEPIHHVAFASGRETMGRLGDPLGRYYEATDRGDRMLFKVDGVAVIPVEGTLVHKGKFLGQSSGETSYEGLQARIARARRDGSVRGVVFEVDSFGGEVAGAFDVHQAIAELSAEKPTIAILTDFALSAGYLLASAARRIIMPESGWAGSIGVITLHADYSKALEQRGIKVTVLSSGRHKADGNPFEALADDVAERIRASLDKGRELFADAVARGRGERLTKAAAIATEALDYRGADAVATGLVDALARPSEAFEEFIREVHAAGRPSQPRGAIMDNSSLAAVKEAAAGSVETITKADHEAAVAAAVATATASAKADGIKEGVAAERTRIAAILRADAAKERTATAMALALDTDMAAEAALKVLAVTPEAKGSRLDALMAGNTPKVDPVETSGAEAAGKALAAAVQQRIKKFMPSAGKAN